MTAHRILQRVLMGVAALAVIGIVAPQFVAATSVVGAGVYTLGDHPDGALTDDPGPYGLRVDVLPGSPGPTFSTELGGANTLLTWDGGNTANISGTLWNNTTSALWDVNYDITGVVTDGAGIGFRATGGSGELRLGGVSQLTWTSKQNGAGWSFLFLEDGHRLPNSDGLVGRGWLDLATRTTNDWLVTATLVTTTAVPEPATFGLFGAGLAGLALLRRRQNRR